MVTIKSCLSDGISLLGDKVDMPRLEAQVLLAHVLKKDRIYLASFGEKEITKEQKELFLSLCQRRQGGEPTAYITGEKEFMSLPFKVDPGVLIPRPETELLAEKIIEAHHGTAASFIDICTGSGAIACSLAYYLEDSQVLGVDISPRALEIAKENAVSNKVCCRTRFLEADALRPIEVGQLFDVAVSNPPYIESAEIDSLDCGVKSFEPRLALDGGEDGLIFYRSITDNIGSVLKKGGMLYFEIGYNQADDVCRIMSPFFDNICVTKDLAGLDRIVSGQLR